MKEAKCQYIYSFEIEGRRAFADVNGDEWLFCTVGKKASQFYDEVHKCLREQIGYIRQVTEDIQFTFIDAERVLLLRIENMKHLLDCTRSHKATNPTYVYCFIK